MTDGDGINGTDANVAVLFPDRPSGAGLGIQPEVIQTLESFVAEAKNGRITGVMIIGVNDGGGIKTAISGKVPFRDGISAIDQMKFGMLARDYAANIQSQINRND